MRQNTVQAAKQSRSQLRNKLRSSRSKLSESLRASHNVAIGHHLLRLVKSQGAGSVACYWPFNGEPDITPVYEQLIAAGCELALPVISENNDNTMRFHAWRQDTDRLDKNTWDIPLHGVVNERGWFTFVGEDPLNDFVEE